MRFLACFAMAALAVPGWAARENPTESEIQEIIKKFAGKEAEFAVARENYVYRQTVRVQEFTEDGTPGGRFDVESDIVFNPDGKRTERIARAPVPTLRLVSLSPEDEQDLRSVQPFVLTSKDVGKYDVRYLGRETLDEIPCYTFAVKPKKMEPGQRYFSGVIWVDDRDLQIVKTYGRGTGVQKKGQDQQFPKFETYREQIDGKFWFPTYTFANDLLEFDSGQRVRIKMTVKYEDYKQFKSDVKITFGDAVEEGKTGEGKANTEQPPKKP
jgi:hypothetical protein